MAKSVKASDDIPTEAKLVALTIERIERVAALREVSPQAICRLILNDNKIYDGLASGERSISLRTYGVLHAALAEYEAEGTVEERKLREAEAVVKALRAKKKVAA